MTSHPPTRLRGKIAILVSYSGTGGVEKMTNHLITGLLAVGIPIDLLLIKAAGPHVRSIPADTNIIKLGTAHTFATAPALARYLRAQRPAALLAVKHRALLVAAWTKRLYGLDTPVVGQIHTDTSASVCYKGAIARWMWYHSIRQFYPWTDCIVGVSEGVSKAIRDVTGLDQKRVITIYNPGLPSDLQEAATQPVDHPWLRQDAPPLILSAGRFTPQKDFPTLIRAFERARRQLPCRLMILGDGPRRRECEVLVKKLGLEHDVTFPGHVDNPYPYMACAHLFVLSSAWEGFGVVLAEAMGLGIPVASTDCPSGPREILVDGLYGPLVPVGNCAALADAMVTTLRTHQPAAILKEAAQRFTIERCVEQYLKLFRALDTAK